MKKLFRIVLAVVIVALSLNFSTISSYAYGENFDPVYYATKYPDVVQVYGTTDPEIMWYHYVNYGAKEGRFQNAYEELTAIYRNGATGIIDPSIVPQPGYEASSYVDVDINKQIVSFFNCGVLEWQAFCVTGTANGRRDTPKGTFSIIRKVPGKRLKGPTWNVWVDRWMQFTTSACGFHDASWRSVFGGEIYKTSGSHGCVNLSKQAAYELYDKVSVGTVVIVH